MRTKLMRKTRKWIHGWSHYSLGGLTVFFLVILFVIQLAHSPVDKLTPKNTF